MTKHSIPYPPYGLRVEEAAAYLGMSRTKFLELVEDGRLPKPTRIDGMCLWCRIDLEAAFRSFVNDESPNSFDQTFGLQ